MLKTRDQVVAEALARLGKNLGDLPLANDRKQEARIALAEAYTGRPFGDEDELVGHIRDDGNRDLMHAVNDAMLDLFGFGPDKIVLADMAAPYLALGPTTNLLEYEREYWREQRGTTLESDPSHKGLYFCHFRWRENGGIVYGFVSTAESWLLGKLDEASYDIVSEAFPQPQKKFDDFESFERDLLASLENPSPADEKRTKAHQQASSIVCDMMFDEGGSEVFAGDPLWASVKYESTEDERQCRVVLPNIEALTQVRFSHFLEDLAKLPKAEGRLEKVLASRQADLEIRLRAACSTIATGS